MNYSDASQAAMMGRPAYMTGAYAPAPRPQSNVVKGYQPNTSYYDQSRASMQTGVGGAYHDYAGHGYKKADPYVAPTPIVGALRATSLNPNGIRRNSNTFEGTRTAAAAPTGKVNPNGVDRSARVSATTNE